MGEARRRARRTALFSTVKRENYLTLNWILRAAVRQVKFKVLIGRIGDVSWQFTLETLGRDEKPWKVELQVGKSCSLDRLCQPLMSSALVAKTLHDRGLARRL
jgi:hypothetical protein